MKLEDLYTLSCYISTFDKLYHIKRCNDMLFKLELSSQSKSTQTLYFDMSRSKSTAFISPSPIISPKHYSAPFDKSIERLNNAKILACYLLNNDRILRLELEQKSSYKLQKILLQFEFSGKHTNVIILDSSEIIIDALRHISLSQSFRPVKIGAPLSPLPKKLESNLAPKSTSKDIDQAKILALLSSNFSTLQASTLNSQKSALIKSLSKSLARLESLLDSLPSPSELESSAKALNEQATMLLPHLYSIKPYASHFALPSDSSAPISIPLPKARTPQEAINLMFKESKKLAKKSASIHKERQNLESKIAFLKREISFINEVKTLDTLKILQENLNKSSAKNTQQNPPNKSNRAKKPQNNASQNIPCVVMFIEGFKISMGRNERENKILLESARADDLWLHIRDIPSSHMIIHCGKQRPSDEVIEKAGEILLGLNGAANGNFCVDCTRRKFVKIQHGANVIYSKHTTLHYRK